MKDAMFTDEEGKKQPYYMGSYGLGLARTLTTVVEEYHDDRGIVWPKAIAPFNVHLISLRENEKAEDVYKKLSDAGIDALYDDREEVSAGQKFADADLIGIPVRLVFSAKTGDKIEWKERTASTSNAAVAELLSFDEVLTKLTT
jgi:prolyl-tRNA synthetase